MRVPLWLAFGFATLGCGARDIPDPRLAAQTFARALGRGDTERVAALMSRGSRTSYGKAGITRLLRAQRPELQRKAGALSAPIAQLSTRPQASVLYANGQLATLVLEDDRFRIDSTAGLPAHAKTPAEALEALRGALELAPLGALLLTLSPRVRATLEVDLRGLIESLRAPDAADLEVTGDRATATLAGGYIVLLAAEDGLWFVEDFR